MRDRFDLDALVGQELQGFGHGGIVLRFELQDDFSGAGGDFGTADVKYDIHRFGHLIDDGLFDQIVWEDEFDLFFHDVVASLWSLVSGLSH